MNRDEQRPRVGTGAAANNHSPGEQFTSLQRLLDRTREILGPLAAHHPEFPYARRRLRLVVNQ